MIFMGNELLERLKNNPLWKDLAEKTEKGIIKLEPVEPLSSEYLKTIDRPVEPLKSVRESKVTVTDKGNRFLKKEISSVEHSIERSMGKKYKNVQLSVEFREKLRALQKEGESVESALKRMLNL